MRSPATSVATVHPNACAGDLLLDERIAPAVALELADRRHKIGSRSRWSSGAAPVLIRITPDGAIEAGADPYSYRVAHAW